MQRHFGRSSDPVRSFLGRDAFCPPKSSLPCLCFQDFMVSCRHSALHIILIPRELCHPAAPAVWYLRWRTAWSPRLWVKPGLMFFIEPSQHTRALQVGVCGLSNKKDQVLSLGLAGTLWNPIELPRRYLLSSPCCLTLTLLLTCTGATMSPLGCGSFSQRAFPVHPLIFAILLLLSLLDNPSGKLCHFLEYLSSVQSHQSLSPVSGPA